MTDFFHWYGLIVGLATVVGLLLAEYRFKKTGVLTAAAAERFFWSAASWTLVGGVIGARVWHVITDWPLYQDNLTWIFEVWRGGLSIIGAISGGMLGFFLYSRVKRLDKNIFWTSLDSAVFGLPFGQALGRIGNYLNQELIGVHHQPLWAYEACLTLLFGLGLWVYEVKKGGAKIKPGRYFGGYLLYYAWIRFWLDFLRLDKAIVPGLSLGINQVFLLLVMSIMVIILYTKKFYEKSETVSRRQ